MPLLEEAVCGRGWRVGRIVWDCITHQTCAHTLYMLTHTTHVQTPHPPTHVHAFVLTHATHTTHNTTCAHTHLHVFTHTNPYHTCSHTHAPNMLIHTHTTYCSLSYMFTHTHTPYMLTHSHTRSLTHTLMLSQAQLYITRSTTLRRAAASPMPFLAHPHCSPQLTQEKL